MKAYPLESAREQGSTRSAYFKETPPVTSAIKLVPWQESHKEGEGGESHVAVSRARLPAKAATGTGEQKFERAYFLSTGGECMKMQYSYYNGE